MMNPREINELLLADMEHKKTFQANYPFECECGEQVEQGDDFVFMGERGRRCMGCFHDICEHLGEHAEN